MLRQCNAIYRGTMPLGIVQLGILVVTSRGRDGAQNISDFH